jgi:uncharacterized protein YjdB
MKLKKVLALIVSAAMTLSAVSVTAFAADYESITVTPGTVEVEKGSSQDFNATVYGQDPADQSVDWSISAVTGAGTDIDADGNLTIDAEETAGTITVTATSQAEGSVSGTATVTVIEAAAPAATYTSVTLDPTSASVAKGGSQTFTATVTGENGPDQSVTWEVTGGSGTTAIVGGTLTIDAAESATELTVKATSVGDTSKYAEATVTVTAATAPGAAGYDSQADILGGGESDWFELNEVYDIVVPTARNLDFTIDPQGLAGIDSDGKYLEDFLNGIGAGTAGVTFAASTELRVINRSSVPVAATISLEITGDATAVTADTGNLALVLVDANGDTPAPNNIAMYAIPSSADLQTEATAYVSSETGFAIDSTQTDFLFKLPSAKYKIKRDAGSGELALALDPDTGHGQAFTLAGFINSKADWSDYIKATEGGTKTMGLKASYTFVDLAVADLAPVNAVADVPYLDTNASSVDLRPAATYTGVTLDPTSASVAKGGTQSFTATVQGANDPVQTVTWDVTGEEGATTIVDGLLTSGADETAETLTVVATSTGNTSISGTATVTVTAPAATYTGVTVSPASQSVAKGGTQTFTATVQGTNDPAQTVTWTVDGNGTTAITSGGVLTIDAAESAGTLTVTATSTGNTSISGTATVTVTTPAPAVETGWAEDTVTNADISDLTTSGDDVASGFFISEEDQAKTLVINVGPTSGSEPVLASTNYYIGEDNQIYFRNAYVITLGVRTRYVVVKVDGNAYDRGTLVTAA